MTWEKVKLGDIAEFSNGINFDKSCYSAGIKLIGVSNFGTKLFPNYDELQEVKPEIVRCNDYLKNNDIIFVRSNGNKELVGRCMLIKDLPCSTTFSGFCIRLRFFDQLKYYPLFFAYLFRSLHFRQAMSGTAVGANIQNLSQNRLSLYEATIPSFEYQKRIATILSTYDELIENNKKQIKLLEEAAQRLYKEWFVDLRFPGHENTKIVDGVPEGWVVCTLQDVIEFDPKIKLTKERCKQSVPMVALSTSSMVLYSTQFTNTFLNSGSKFQNGDTLLARITPCLENGKTAFVQGIESEEGAVGSTEYIVMRSKKLNSYMVYLLARTEAFREYAINSMTGSDGRQRVNSAQLKTLEFALPPQKLVDEFGKVASPLFDKIHALNQQCIRLAEQRDLLLPKLMSGEHEV